jgi:hypothetical protein
VARSSKRRDRGAASALLFLVAVCLVILAVAKIRQNDWHDGTKYIVWALIPLVVLLGFTLPVRCKVKTTRSTPCGNDAFGLLFGCSKTASHRFGKFRARFGSPREEYVGQGRGTRAVMYQPAPGPKAMKLTVEDSLLAKCASWATLASAVIAVIGILFQAHVL